MKINEIVKEFGITEKTAYNWKNSDSSRKLLYEVLKRLPLSFVEETKTLIRREKKLADSLK
ncbi:MAG: hypothetical protein COB42_06760 [Sulfurimonas sp.]|nr:MAG: hypothetical protein COB42_06760 [Sulfurimonas sp.]